MRAASDMASSTMPSWPILHSTTHHPVPRAALSAADALAIVVGRALGKRLPEKVIAYGAAALFFLFGIWLTIEAIAQLT